jgi:hypothetical protein
VHIRQTFFFVEMNSCKSGHKPVERNLKKTIAKSDKRRDFATQLDHQEI